MPSGVPDSSDAGVPAMYLLDLSEYTFHQDDPEVRKEIEKKGLKTGLHFM